MKKEQGQKIIAGATTLMVAEPAMHMLGTGGPGVIVGLAAAAAAYIAVDEIQRVRRNGREETPALAHEQKKPAGDGKPSLAYRLVNGKSVREDNTGTPSFDSASEDDELAPPVLVTGGPLYFSEVLKTFKPTLDKIYLATLPDGKPVFVPARNLCHTALAGATRGGKDHIIRCLMSQLCYAGAKVYLLDPNYTRYDLESVDPFGRSYPEDWTPFDAWLKNDPREMVHPGRKYKVIEHYLGLAFDLVERRLESRGSGVRLGAPQFLFVNELPAIVDEVPKTAYYLKKILREGAKVGVFLVNASQDFHVSTIFKEIGGGVRKCYRTAFDVGSDTTTQNALGLLPLKQLGKGSGSLRCDDILSACRLAYVDNEALYALLGPSTYVAGSRQTEEEDLVAYAMGARDSEEEPDTEKLPATRYTTRSAYEELQKRKTSHRPAAYTVREPAQERPVAHPPEPPMQEEVEISAQDAFAVWSAGNSNVRDLAKAMGITIYKATQLYGEMVKEGLIQRKTKVTVKGAID